VGVGKSDQDAVGNMITGTPVPAFINIGWAQLDSPKRHISTDKNMPVPARTDKGIDREESGFLKFRFLVTRSNKKQGTYQKGGEQAMPVSHFTIV